jgi:UDP-glucose 4-epimerase
MKHLITGGVGFIGSHLAAQLLEAGQTVYVIDDLSTGNIENIDPFRDDPSFHHVVDSIFNESVLAEMVDRCDVVFHLAAAVGVRLVVENPVRTIETNIHGTELVLRSAARKKKKVLIASTSEVYGKASPDQTGPKGLQEDDDMRLGPTCRSRWSYACSKAIDEFLGLAYYAEKGVPVIVVRFFNTVGPGQIGTYGMVVPRFVRQALSGGPITVYGDGQMVRCFAHVDDAVGALVKLVQHPEAPGQVFNIGSDEAVTIDELAERVRARVDPALEIRHVPFEEVYGPGFEDIRWRVPDISKLHELIDYRPTKDLDQIVDEVVAYERARLSDTS